jgi:hypothetical protein
MEEEELAAAVLGRLEEYEDGNYINFEDALMERFGINMDQFHKIALALVPFTQGWMSPITDTHYQGFVNEHVVLMKRAVKTEGE